MLCCSLIAVLLGQFGALGAAMKVRLLGGSGAMGAALAPLVAGWPAVRWLAMGGFLAAEFVIAGAVLPTLYAIDVPRHLLGAWPLCSALAALAQNGH